MTRFDDLFVDARAYLPPTPWQARFSNLLVLLTAGLLLLGGWMFKDWMQDQFRYLALNENEIAIPYPPNWVLSPTAEGDFQALDPDGPREFPAREQVRILPLPDAPLATYWPGQRAAELDDYIELERRPVTLTDGREALLLGYAYAVRAEDAAPLVAVRAVDLVFIGKYEGERRLVVVTLAAASGDWERAWPTFQRVLAKLGVEDATFAGK